MLVRFLLFAFVLALPGIALAQSPTGGESQEADSVAAPSLKAELLAMLEADQAARRDLLASIGEDGQPDMSAVMAVMEVDAANVARLKEIVAEADWPGRSLVGEEGRNAVFLLVQHADREPSLQREYLDHLRTSYEAGEAPADDVALLTDRVCKNAGEPQLYGTQVSLVNGEIEVYETEDPEGLDERRAEMGLPPMAEYLETVRASIGQ